MSDLAIVIIIFVSCMLIFFLGFYLGFIRGVAKSIDYYVELQMKRKEKEDKANGSDSKQHGHS